jgi:IS30 family transposase
MGHTQAMMAKYLKRNQSTISRELARNKASPRLGYLPDRANQKAKERKQEAKWNVERWYNRKSLSAYVEAKLKLLWSPEQIEGRLKQEYTQESGMWVSHESVYLYIYEDKQRGGELYTYLRQGKRKRQRRTNTKEGRGMIRDRVSIEQRPQEVANKKRYGDWEGDLMVGKGHQGVLATMVERKSYFTLAKALDDKKAPTMTKAVKQLYKAIPTSLRKTMTYDNGKEIAEHKKISKALGMSIYFAHPYSSWERGINENTNGLLRQFFPKTIDFTNVTEADVAYALQLLNNRPRKTLLYRTPYEVFNEQLQLCI